MKKLKNRLTLFLLMSMALPLMTVAADNLSQEQIDFIYEFNRNNPVIPKEPESKDTPQAFRIQNRTSFPTKFNTDKTIGTPIKNQGKRSICWAYASSALVEQAIANKYNVEYAFSPDYLDYISADDSIIGNPKNPYSFGRNLDTGANPNNTLPLYVQGKAPILVKDFNTTYPNKVNIDFFDKESAVDVASYVSFFTSSISKEHTPELINTYKELIMENGAVEYNYDTHRSANVSNSKGTIYNDKGGFINHSTILIGWDDSYDKNNFNISPKNNGAFIMKNSWGTGYGDKGYYYVSYEDAFLLNTRFISISEVYPEKQFYNSYISMVGPVVTSTSEKNHDTRRTNVTDRNRYHSVMFINDFIIDKHKNEDITSVSIGLNEFGRDYEIFINPDGTDVNDFSTLEKVASGTHKYPGVERIQLDKKIKITSKDKVAMIVKFKFRSNDDKIHFNVGNNKNWNGKRIASSRLLRVDNYVDKEKTELESWSDSVLDMNIFTDKEILTPVHSISLNSEMEKIEVGQSSSLLAKVHPASVSNTSVKYTSSNPKIVTVPQIYSGRFEAKKTGAVTITAQSDLDRRKTALARIYVFNSFNTAIDVLDDSTTTGEVSYENQEMYYKFKASKSGKYSIKSNSNTNFDTQGYLYDSSKRQLAYNDDSNGNRQFLINHELKANEEYFVKVRGYGNSIGKYQLIVKPDNVNVPVESVEITADTNKVEIGKTIKLTSITKPNNATNKNVNWISSNSKVATVSSGGEVRGGAIGSTTITAIEANSNKSASMIVYVTNGFNTAINISDDSTTTGEVSYENQEMYYKFKASKSGKYSIKSNSDTNFDTQGYLYDSSKRQLAYNDDSNGNRQFLINHELKANEEYFVKVRGYGNSIGKYQLIVKPDNINVPVESVEITADTNKVEKGKTIKLTSITKPDNATNKNINWISSNYYLADVSSDGVVTGKERGEVTISACTELGKKIATYTIYIYNSFDTAIELENADWSYDISGFVTNDLSEVFYKFTAKESINYTVGTCRYKIPVNAYLYDENKKLIASNEKGDTQVVMGTPILNKGKTYYIKYTLRQEPGSFGVFVLNGLSGILPT